MRDERDPLADRDREAPPPLPAAPGGCGRVAKGCGCAALVVLLAAAAVGTWVALSWRQWAVAAVRQVTEAALDETPLPADQRRRILATVDGLGEEFTAGRIGVEQMARVAEELTTGPVVPLAFLAAIDGTYLRGSGLPDGERAAARRMLERAARGVATGTIEPEEALELLQPLLERDGDDADSFRFRKRLSDDELRGFVAEVRRRVEAAGVPDEPFEVDVAAEVEAAVGRALGRGAGGGRPKAAAERSPEG